MRDFGWVEGRNIILGFRLAHFDWTLLPRLAQELVNLPVEVIVTTGRPAGRIAMEATSEVPIVTIGVDPALFGLVGSLARPRVNVTGFTVMTPELSWVGFAEGSWPRRTATGWTFREDGLEYGPPTRTTPRNRGRRLPFIPDSRPTLPEGLVPEPARVMLPRSGLDTRRTALGRAGYDDQPEECARSPGAPTR